MVKFLSSHILVISLSLSLSPGYLWWVLYIREWDRAALSGPKDYGETNLTCRVCRSVSFLSTAVLFAQFYVLFCSCVIVSLCFQVKAGMGRYGGGLGWGRAWPSRSSPLGTNSPGSERQRSIIQCSYDMTTYWVWQQIQVPKKLFMWCRERCSVISNIINQKTDIEIMIFYSGFRFYSLWHDIQEFQHPAVARHPLSWAGLALWLPAVQQLGARELPEDVPVCSLWPGPPPHWDCQLPGKASYCPPRPEKSKHPGKAERTVLHCWPRWGLCRNKDSEITINPLDFLMYMFPTSVDSYN